MNNEIDEKWIDFEPPKSLRYGKHSIISISNTGKFKKLNGESGILRRAHCVIRESGKLICSHIIAEHFLITVRRPDQIIVDHITHFPTEYNVNDVRNLRWCTKVENSGFPEARENLKASAKRGSDSNLWKGDDVGPQAAYLRAKKLYKDGKLTEEDLNYYHDGYREYKREYQRQYRKGRSKK